MSRADSDFIGHFDVTRPEFDLSEAATMKALPVLQSADWEDILKSDEFHEEITEVASQGHLKWASFGRMSTGASKL